MSRNITVQLTAAAVTFGLDALSAGARRLEQTVKAWLAKRWISVPTEPPVYDLLELLDTSAGSVATESAADAVGRAQILADPRLPPLLAQQIARLQLPVLRTALGDPGFLQTFSEWKRKVEEYQADHRLSGN